MKRHYLTPEQEALYRGASRLVTPSAIDPWEGDYDGASRYTVRQLRALREAGHDPATIDYLEVETPGDPRRLYIPLITYFWRRVACPVVGASGRLLRVIAPGGAIKLVHPNGQRSRQRGAPGGRPSR